jgi:hypothetical protein
VPHQGVESAALLRVACLRILGEGERPKILPTLTATLTTIAFDDSSLQRFEART